MRLVLLAAVAALAVACSPAEEVDVMSEGCEARGVSQWTVNDQLFSIEATTEGPDCARAVATLTVRNTSGEPIYTQSHITSDLMTLAPAVDPAAMNTALTEWVAPETTMSTTSNLPEWAANADNPGGEFPFYVGEGYTRESYAAMRAVNDPMFCYVQGMESLSCIIYGDGGIEHIGVQAFPG